jgi:hypothetical protein
MVLSPNNPPERRQVSSMSPNVSPKLSSMSPVHTRRGRAEELSPRVRLAESPSHPDRASAMRSDLSPQRGARVRSTDRSAHLPLFWRCGTLHFSFRRIGEAASATIRQGFWPRIGLPQGSGNADSQLKVRSSGGSGRGRSFPGDSGCVRANPASWRASASYLPLRAVWAVGAWALRGCARSKDPFLRSS